MAAQNFLTVDARCACQKALAQGRLLRLMGLFQIHASGHNRANISNFRSPASGLGPDSDSKPPA